MFWVTTLVTKKNLSKILLSWGNLVLQKGTKESKISLGSWLVFWEANNMCNFIVEYETLNYSKGNYLKSKLQIFIKMLAKRGQFQLDLLKYNFICKMELRSKIKKGY